MHRIQILLLAFVLVSLGWGYAEAQESRWPGEHKEYELNASTKFLVTQAIAEGHKTLPFIVAANKGETAEVERLVEQAGGTVLKSIPEIGYIHAILPANKSWWLIRQSAVTDIAVAGGYMFRDDLRSAVLPKIEETNTAIELREGNETAERKKALAADRETGDVDLLLPLLPSVLLDTKPGLNANAYLQQPEWLKAHPTWDGRGVTIVSIEGMPGLDHPALQEATDFQGNPIPKIGGVIDAVDYEHRNPGNYLSYSYPGNYFSPRDADVYGGEVRFGREARLSDGEACPVPENPGESVGVWKATYYYVHTEYCVAWNVHDKVARIDLKKDGRFADQQPLSDFNQAHSFVKIPYTATAEDGQSEHYFTVYLIYDKPTGTVSILPSNGDHSAMTATAAAGTGYMGTSVGGMAPGARLMFLRPNRENTHVRSEQIEGVWKAMARPDVGLLNDSDILGGDRFPSEARTVSMLFHDRISEVTGKPIVAATGNSGLPFENGYDHGRLVIGVGGYISDAQMQAFRYSKQPLNVPFADNVMDYSSSGPNADGSLSTDVLTPVPGIAGANCGSDHYSAAAAQAQVGFAFRLPACYTVSGGTSTAAPRAAGALALLLSAAKQEHLKVTVEQIKNALIVSARYLPGEPAFRQGPGLLQVEDAWQALEEAAHRSPISITSNTPDISPLYPQYWRGPLIGKSIYLTRGFHPGEKKRLRLDLNVTGVSTKDLSFRLLGNDGTYQIASIQSDVPGHSQIFVDALATSMGSKSALLEVHAKGWMYPIARLLILSVATPPPQSLYAGVTLQGKYEYEILSSDFFVFEPPQGAAAIEVVGVVEGSPLYVDFVMGANPALTYNPNNGHQETGSPILNGQRTFFVPLLHPDLFGMMIRNSHYHPCCVTTYKFTVRALTASELAASTSQTDPVLRVAAEEEFRAAPILGTPAREASIPVADGADAAVISFPHIQFNPAKPYAIEAYLYDPPGEKQGLWNYFSVIDPGTRLAVPKPRAGTWKLVLLGPDPGPIKVELLRQTARGKSSSAKQYLAFGALCSGAQCADTWPLENPLWRFMPLLPLSAQDGDTQ